jgi:hypothetical protein
LLNTDICEDRFLQSHIDIFNPNASGQQGFLRMLMIFLGDTVYIKVAFLLMLSFLLLWLSSLVIILSQCGLGPFLLKVH